MAPADGLDALDQRRSARKTKRQLQPPRHPKAQPATARVSAAHEVGDAAPEVPEVAPAPLKAVEATEKTLEPGPAEPAPRRRSRVRATQVHLDEVADEHLSELRKRAVLADVDLNASAVLRLGLNELVDRYGYDRIVVMFAEGVGQIRRGRPRS